ncbi:hypothetical protein SDJN02_09909, partial [Cucurbita argyrosperma subsp. argyrosperma]
MSFNQSRRDLNEESQFKKSVRSSSLNQQRNSSGLHSKSGDSGKCAPPIVSNHSFKQSSDVQHARKSRAGVSSVNSTVSTVPRGGQNGSHVHPQQNGSASNPAKLTESQSAIVRKNATSQTTSKASNAFSESKSGIVQNNATSKPTSKTSYTNASSTPVKDWAEEHKTFSLQFGSLSPGFQIPRTSSAPSNPEELIPNQAQHHLFKSVPPGSVQPIAKSPNIGKPVRTSESNAAERGGSSTSNEVPRAEFSVERASSYAEVSNCDSDSKTLEKWDEPVSSHAEVDSSKDNNVLSNSITHGNKTSLISASSCQSDGDKNTEMRRADLQSAPVQTSELSEMKHEGDRLEHTGFQCDPNFIPVVEDKPVTDTNKTKNRSKRGKKKRKEILRKADAEEKKEIVMSAESSNGSLNMKQESAGSIKDEAVLTKKNVEGKLELDDWEDAVDVSTVKLKDEGSKDKANGKVALHHEGGGGDMAKKYSRDFLLKFAEQFADLPDGFETTPNTKALMSINHGSRSVNSKTFANLEIMDKLSGGARLDHHAITVDDRLFASGRDSHLDSGRPTQWTINGALKNPRAHIGSQGKIQRNDSNVDRWQRDTNFHLKGLVSPPTPLQMMHRAEKKYEVGKVADEEETKQRQLKAILNKLTPQNFEKLFEQVKAVNIDSSKTLIGVINQIFDKALMEPTFCEMYADFCLHLADELPDFSDDNQKITFKRLLLNKCQEEFEREQEENDEVNKVSEMKQPAEEQEEKRIKARRRMLGNIRLIGELYKKKMITEKIMHVCIRQLLGQYQNPDEEDIEALCKLMSTIGDMIDHPKAKEHMDAYFEMITKLSNNMKLSSRVRFLLKDTIDLRKNKWQLRRKVEGPKKINEVHRDAVQERQAQTSRLGRGPRINASLRGTSMDFGSRASALLPSPNAQAGGFHGSTPPVCGSSIQDTRFEAKAFPSPLPRRLISDDAMTLGPQGHLARGMSIKGPRSVSSTPLPTGNNTHRMTAALSSISKGDTPSRNLSQEPGIANGYKQLANIDSSLGSSQSIKCEQPASTPNGHSEVMSKERLRYKSIAAIREYYSARDEKEVTLCIKDLNSPGFHSSMISLWVTDSFERENKERDLLAKLLVSLTKSQDGTLTQRQLVEGIQLVLATLEDAVNDAPKAPEFMGRLLANMIWEDLIPLKEIGKFIQEGGEEAGSLLEVGLAADVLGNVLEAVQLEKGQIFVNEILQSSNLQLETFQPSYPIKPTKLEKFI